MLERTEDDHLVTMPEIMATSGEFVFYMIDDSILTPKVSLVISLSSVYGI